MSSDNKYVKEFLKIVCREVHIKSIHKNINEELEAHIEDQKNFYIKQGFDEEAAFIESVKQMGDPILIGKQLDMTHRIKAEWSILLITGFLVVIAGIVQYFLSKVGSGNYDNFLRFLLYMPLGIAAFSTMYFLDYTVLKRYSKIAYFAILTITIVSLLFTNPTNGVYNQAYYFYLIITPILAGVIFNFRSKGYVGIIYSGLFCVGAALPCILASSYSSLLLLDISCLIIITSAIEKGFFERNKKVSLSIVYFPTILMIIIPLFLMSPYRKLRLIHLLNPGSEPSGIGFLTSRVKSLLSGAQPVGTTILGDNLAGKSIERLLPEWNTGFSFTYIIAKFGYIFAIAIAVILIILLLRIFMSVHKQKNAYGFLVSFSACIAITAQILFYILSNLGVISPVTVTLPFISFGAISFILNMSLMGLLLSVYRRTDIVKDKLKINEGKKQLFTFEYGKIIIDLGVKSKKRLVTK
jgi:cell division protein FtsW (lipid II flippase)